jgi:hypothetical protein
MSIIPSLAAWCSESVTRRGLLNTARISGGQCARISGKVGVRISGTRRGTLHGSKDTVSLLLDFTNPVEVSARLDFEIVRQGVLVEQILYTKSLYLQAGKAGDRISMTWAAPRIIIEVLDTGFCGFRKFWPLDSGNSGAFGEAGRLS